MRVKVPSKSSVKNTKKPKEGIAPKKKRVLHPAQEILPPCKVCGGKASGLHFGAITCESCKVFFRRALSRDKEYKCSRKQQCKIVPGRRVSCSYCRQKKCLHIGMSKQSVRFGRYTLEQRRDCILEAKGIKDKDKENETNPAKVVSEERDIQYEAEKREKELEETVLQICGIHNKYSLLTQDFLATLPAREAKHIELKKVREKVFGPMKPVSGDTYHEVYRSTGLDVDNRRETINQCMSQTDNEHLTYIAFAKDLPGFKDVPLNDQMTLIRGNRFSWWLLSILPAVNTDDMVFTCPSCGMTFDLDELCTYFGKEFIMDSFRIINIVKNLEITNEETALLKAITVLSSDDLPKDISMKEKVDEQQELLLEALIYHINKTRPKEEHKVAKIMDALIEARCARHEYKKTRTTWFDLWPDLDYTPLCLELVSCEV